MKKRDLGDIRAWPVAIYAMVKIWTDHPVCLPGMSWYFTGPYTNLQSHW